MERLTCTGCGATFGCGRVPGEERCWCGSLPRVMPVPEPGASCLCPVCLRNEIERQEERKTGTSHHPPG